MEIFLPTVLRNFPVPRTCFILLFASLVCRRETPRIAQLPNCRRACCAVPGKPHDGNDDALTRRPRQKRQFTVSIFFLPCHASIQVCRKGASTLHGTGKMVTPSRICSWGRQVLGDQVEAFRSERRNCRLLDSNL